jgi:hypothetical protein
VLPVRPGAHPARHLLEADQVGLLARQQGGDRPGPFGEPGRVELGADDRDLPGERVEVGDPEEQRQVGAEVEVVRRHAHPGHAWTLG